jgi:N-acetyl-gamma-glutamyl-phosphate/LysW-gamma-L-alpha-aminoadipyl-6-phosphate reductase
MTTAPLSCAIIGGTGYTGGELLRLLNNHPQAKATQITSRSRMGEYAHVPHPNLRNTSAGNLQFIRPEDVKPCDVIFLCLPHGEATTQIDKWAALAPNIIDLSADFRLQDHTAYAKWYDGAHPAPHWVKKFVYGLPEISRDHMRGAHYISGVGCNATATNLALLPLVKAGLLDLSLPILADIKVGSSEAGAEANDASHHPERSGAVRVYAPAGHRHTAEVEQMIRTIGTMGEAVPNIHMTVSSIEMVRGVSANVHVFLKEKTDEKALWKAFRTCYKNEPFVRIVKATSGIFRAPEPKILAGSNWADVGFYLSEDGLKATLICAIDNMMKGAAGSAVQCLNVLQGWDERAGLEFTGLHP